ncbi:MAG: helix-turn-helix domain-containing protein [Bacteroidales bacterium]|nr:helix-turn-helix domain-containing protein [Bacteroidales bacterium]
MEINKLKKRLKERGLNQKELCDSIGMTPNGLRLAIERQTLSIGTLYSISDRLGVPVKYWFEDESVSANSAVKMVFRALESVVVEEMIKDRRSK